MLNLKKLIKPWQESGALNANINLYGFLTDDVFLTKSGDLGMVLVCRAKDLPLLRHGVNTRIAGYVIARQRTGTAKGFFFFSIEDENGTTDAIIAPEFYELNRALMTYARFLLIEGTLQNVDEVVHIRVRHIAELNVTAALTQSHDFH